MSKKYSGDVKVIKRKGVILKTFGSFFIFILIANIVFWSGFGLSKLLTAKSFIWFKSDKIKIASLNFYAIAFGEYETEAESSECAIWTASSGGAAYVYCDKKFVVVGQLYENIDDANKVIENFSPDITYPPMLKQYKTKKLSFKIDNVKASEKKDIEDIFSLANLSVNNVLDISNKIDTNILSNVSASSEINLIKSEIKIAKTNLDAINSSYNNEYLTEYSKYLLKAEDSLDICINKLLTSDNYSNVCKYCACELFFNFYEFSKNIVK